MLRPTIIVLVLLIVVALATSGGLYGYERYGVWGATSPLMFLLLVVILLIFFGR